MRMTDYHPANGGFTITCPDLTESMLFYTELGFDVLCTDEDSGAASPAVCLELGDIRLRLIQTESAAMVSDGTVCFTIVVEDIAGAFDLICSRGLNNLDQSLREGVFWGKPSLFFSVRGPAGEHIRFVSA